MPSFEKRNVLVTGGAGFLGSHLCDVLMKTGARVLCVDNFSTGIERNIDGLLRHPDFQFIRADISQPINLEQYPELEAFKIPFQGIQEIYHLACPTAMKRFDAMKIPQLLAQGPGTLNVLALAEKYGARVVFTSSSVVYGPRGEHHVFSHEDDLGAVDHLLPRAAYDEGKRFSETCCELYRQARGVDARIVRVFRTYGPRMPLAEGFTIPDMIASALDGAPVSVHGGEHFQSSFLYVSDAVDGLLRVMAATENLGPVNIGSDVDLLLADVAARIVALTGSKSQVKVESPLPFLSDVTLPRIEKAKEMLGWIPLVSLDDGLKRTIDDVRANRILLSHNA